MGKGDYNMNEMEQNCIDDFEKIRQVIKQAQ